MQENDDDDLEDDYFLFTNVIRCIRRALFIALRLYIGYLSTTWGSRAYRLIIAPHRYRFLLNYLDSKRLENDDRASSRSIFFPYGLNA